MGSLCIFLTSAVNYIGKMAKTEWRATVATLQRLDRVHQVPLAHARDGR